MDSPIILVGTMQDLRSDAEVVTKLREQHQTPDTTEEGMEMARAIGAAKYLEVSAKSLDSATIFHEAVRVAQTRKPATTPTTPRSALSEAAAIVGALHPFRKKKPRGRGRPFVLAGEVRSAPTIERSGWVARELPPLTPDAPLSSARALRGALGTAPPRSTRRVVLAAIARAALGGRARRAARRRTAWRSTRSSTRGCAGVASTPRGAVRPGWTAQAAAATAAATAALTG